MSYDLMVFELSAAPRERDEFLEWYDQQSEEEEDHNYDDPVVTSSALRSWFMEMIGEFPAMNGPYAPDSPDEMETRVADYSVGKSAIYASFSWSEVSAAYEATSRLAAKHKVGFFDASGDRGAVYVPDNFGTLSILHQSK
jgi:hypothetical protein